MQDQLTLHLTENLQEKNVMKWHTESAYHCFLLQIISWLNVCAWKIYLYPKGNGKSRTVSGRVLHKRQVKSQNVIANRGKTETAYPVSVNLYVPVHNFLARAHVYENRILEQIYSLIQWTFRISLYSSETSRERTPRGERIPLSNSAKYSDWTSRLNWLEGNQPAPPPGQLDDHIRFHFHRLRQAGLCWTSRQPIKVRIISVLFSVNWND